MSICSGIGNGLGGALGKWGPGLGSALGLAGVVDVGVRAYTGYGLVEALNVPYIECEDGSYATAVEWYGSGLKCPPRKPEPTQSTPSSSGLKAALGYASEIEALGGSVYPYIGYHAIGPVDIYGKSPEPAKPQAGHYQSKPRLNDKFGNTLRAGKITEGNGFGDVQGGEMVLGAFAFMNYGWGGWSSSSHIAPAGFDFRNIRTSSKNTEIFNAYMKVGKIIGLRISVPELSKAPPVGRISPPQGFSPNPPRKNKEDCEEVSCPCLTPADIEKAVRKALGLMPFAPEKLVREMGAKMFAAPGPSLIPIVPTSLVDAIAAIQATSYMRAGYGRYPVLMPNSLINDNSVTDAAPTLPIENFAEWFEWSIKQQDAIQGEWPIDIAIVDGAKRQPLSFENLAEAIAELTGLLIQAATDGDASVNAACTAAVAATKATNAAIVGQKNIECLIRFFGVRTGFKSVFVQSPITPADPDDKNFNLRKFLTPSGQNLACLSDEDPFDFQALLDRILRNTEITRASVARNIDKDGLPGDFPRNQRKYDATQERQEAEKELEKLEKSIQAKNPDFKVKIRVDTPANDTIAGNNFVIKRLSQPS
jgi:hypothetical protein